MICDTLFMSTLLRQAIEEIERLPANEQDAAASALMDYLDHMKGLRLSDKQVEEVRKRMASPGMMASLSDVRKRLQRAGK